jgi:N-acetylglucosamine kinase-like BadF-type ATPase
MSVVLGVDGGNTKTIAVVADEGGRTLGAGLGGRGDIYNADTPETAIETIAGVVGEALDAAGARAADVAAATFSLAGADWPEDFALLERALPERLGLRDTPLVVNDALGALRGGAPDWIGVSIVAGTYNAIGARRGDGRVFHLGFWPDGAGGRNIAQDGLHAIYRASLDLGPATSLSERAFALYGADDAIDLLHEFTRRGGLSDADVDRFAPVVLEAADAGDEVAQAIVAEKGAILGRQGRACAAQLDLPLDGLRIVLSGRVLAHPTERLAAAAMVELPGAIAVRHPVPPVAGAVLLALDRIGAVVDVAAVEAALPYPELDGRSARWAESPSRA